MRRRAPLQKLRGSDPVLIEVQIPDLLNRPSGQLEPVNLCDLFALSEIDERPKVIVARLEKFIERAKEEMIDIPDGPPMVAFIDELREVDPTLIPERLRAHLRSLTLREGRENKEILSFLASLEGIEPKRFELGTGVTRVQRAEVSTSAARTSRATGKTTTRKISNTAVVDSEKHEFVCQLVLDRIEASSNNTLGEHVLVAGVRHRGKAQYPDMLPQEINAALLDLLKKGLVRKSAGRWSSTRRR